VARASETDQIAMLQPLPPKPMTDQNPEADKSRSRRQPPVPLAFAVFAAAVVGFMAVVAGLFALLRLLGGSH
jgi:hypothetical protein